MWERELLVFHVRSLSPDNRIIKVPPAGDYYETRGDLFRANPWLNRGCVFLSKKVPNWPEDDKDCSRRCTLHPAESATHITAKPMGCVFYTCVKPIQAKMPTRDETQRWLRALLAVSSSSLERYRALYKSEKAAKRVSDF